MMITSRPRSGDESRRNPDNGVAALRDGDFIAGDGHVSKTMGQEADAARFAAAFL